MPDRYYCIQKLEIRGHKLKIIPSSIVHSGPPESKKMKEKTFYCLVKP